jgi:amidase
MVNGADDFDFDDDALGALSIAADRLRKAGHEVEPVREFLSPADWCIPRRVYLTQVCAQAAADFTGQEILDGLETMNRAAILLGRDMSVKQYLSAVRSGQDFARRFAAIWQRFDVLLTPALAGAAPMIGEYPMDHMDVALHVDRMTRLAPFAGVFNLTGGPALVVSVAQNADGLPLGVQLASDMGHDLQLLEIGKILHRLPSQGRCGYVGVPDKSHC